MEARNNASTLISWFTEMESIQGSADGQEPGDGAQYEFASIEYSR